MPPTLQLSKCEKHFGNSDHEIVNCWFTLLDETLPFTYD